jgi:hyperosmotically inducible periplasmic protein
MRKLFISGVIGAALVYFLDPDTGARRRHVTRDRMGALLRRFARQSEQLVQYAGGRAYGVVQETVPHQHDNPNPDDLTLRDRVESEIFRDPSTPKGQINLSVVEGIVELHGQLGSQDEIDRLIKAVQNVRDVQGVRSYLHLPGTPAPDKADALKA